MMTNLYIPYYPESDDANNVNDMSDQEYADALLNTFGASYSRYMNDVINGLSDTRYDMRQFIPDKYKIASANDRTEVRHYQFSNVILYNDDMKYFTEDEFDYYAGTGEMIALYVRIGSLPAQLTNNQDAVGELNFWLRDSRNVMNDPHIEEDYRVAMLPDKDLIVEFAYDNGVPKARYYLLGSRVIDQDNCNNFALIVNKIKKM